MDIGGYSSVITAPFDASRFSVLLKGVWQIPMCRGCSCFDVECGNVVKGGKEGVPSTHFGCCDNGALQVRFSDAGSTAQRQRRWWCITDPKEVICVRVKDFCV